MGLVVLSPLALRAYDSGDDVDWKRLNEIGGTYGAVSAVVATVALLGVMISLVIQNREVREARRNARRAHHVELMRMAMDDPRYMECWGPYLTNSFTEETQYTYVNLIVAHWFAEYDVGELTDTLLRAMTTNVFASGPGRHYWERTGTFWRDNYPGMRARRFHQVIEETYQDAIRTPPVSPPDFSARNGVEPAVLSPGLVDQLRPDRSRAKVLAAAGSGAAFALIVVQVLRRVLRRP
ncbi:MAG: DUF6082 family protein [Actinophytocola sp.]|uniref:DUF6082 family protein n=1 Tax=Actinophytocola sp. TaxID=1872138 RepID=UPI003C77CD3A